MIVDRQGIEIMLPPEIADFAFNSSGFPLYNNGISAFPDRPDGSRQQSIGLTTSQGWGIHAGGVAADPSYSTFKKVVTQRQYMEQNSRQRF